MSHPKEEQRTLTVAQRIEAIAGPNIGSSAANVLLNLIPYAGGAIASAIGEYASHQRIKKIADILAGLNDALETHKANPERYLTKDQIVELVHDVVQTAVTTSDQKKIEALKYGLGAAFTRDGSFEDKQLFLSLLRSLVSHEIALLRQIYHGRDPYRIEHGRPDDLSVITFGSGGNWSRESIELGANTPTLLNFLATEMKADEATVLGTIRMLDAKGLTDAAAHQEENHSTVYRWRTSASGVISLYKQGTIVGTVKPTPLEASRTRLGDRLMQFF